MKHIISILAALLVLATSCQKGDTLEQKKADYDKLTKEIENLQSKVAGLKAEIKNEDPDYFQEVSKATLVTTIPVYNGPFSHYIDVTGAVSSDENVDISPELPGRVMYVHVQKGQNVKKGRLLVELDASTIRRNIDGVEAQLELATTVFERQKNLWEQNVGTEIQFLEAKTNKQSLESQLASLKAQLDQTRIVAPFNGSVDEVFAKVGQNAQPGIPLIRMVSLDDIYIVGDVSEAFLGSFQIRDSVKVRVPSMNKTFSSVITSVGKVINFDNRTFPVRVKIPSSMNRMNPNLITIIQLEDNKIEDAHVIPSYLIQRDTKGTYVYTAVNGMCKKVYIDTGFSYNNKTQIVEGLKGDEQIIDEGFREVADGTEIKIVEQAV